MRIALVGSRQMAMTVAVAAEVARVVGALRPGDTLLVRSPDGARVTSAFELAATALAPAREVNVELYAPRERDRAAVFHRDYRLVAGADEVLAYFPYETELDGGTWHVIHAAMQKGVPCRAFTITADGRIRLIGSEDGEAMFVDVDDYAYV